VERYSIRRALREMLVRVGGPRVTDPHEFAGLTAARIVDVLGGGSGDVGDPMSLVPLGAWLARMTQHFGGTATTEDAELAARELLATLRGDDYTGEADGRYLGDVLKDVLDALPQARPAGFRS
jgi:hypothetical protein